MMNDTDDFLDFEEAYHSKDKKHSRKERNIAKQKDRSKYKKTDQDKKTSRDDTLKNDEHLGRVLQVLPEHSALIESDHISYTCSFKGSMRFEKNAMRNIIAVGDLVHFIKESQTDGLITHVRTRHSILTRIESKQTQRQQILAANVDQVLITVSVIQPRLKPHLIDRYIIACKSGNMVPIILLNKVDLLIDPPSSISDKEVTESQELFEEIEELYSRLGYLTLPISAVSGRGLHELKTIMHNKISVFSGQSGVGKTTLINAISGKDFKTSDVMIHSQKGMHTTTSALLFAIEPNTYCVDTPGIKSFGMGTIPQEVLRSYFEEITAYSENCKFASCTHIHEPSCAVKEAVETGEISHLRYLSYCNLLSER
ncbi:MAG: ribosome small subunit-dependent GTPase A [Simkaniaceae bacterium]|nr:ribosome small subunit-dependent GTPase A [Simkaniaceae bacterium]